MRFQILSNSRLEQLLLEENNKQYEGLPSSEEFHKYLNIRENINVVLSERYSIYSLGEETGNYRNQKMYNNF